MTSRLYATFALGDILFGVDATDVQEVLRIQRLTSVPLAATEVSGLMNLRGQIVVTVNLRDRLGMDHMELTDQSINLVLRTDHGPLAVIADEVGDVFEVGDAELAPVPETLVGPTRDLVRAVHKLDDRLLLILDVAAMAEPTLV